MGYPFCGSRDLRSKSRKIQQKSSPWGWICGRMSAESLGVVYVFLPESFAGSCGFPHCSGLRSGQRFLGQAAHSEQVQIMPPLLRMTDPPSPDATAADLEARAEQLRASKLYLDALDYYRAALAKRPNAAGLLNKIGITELMMQRYREAKKSFEQSIKANRQFADPHNNLGVVYYEELKYSAAVKEYRRAIALDSDSASFFSNLGAALFAKKEFDPAVIAYEHAVNLILTCSSALRARGVQAQLPSPGDRARYDLHRGQTLCQAGIVGSFARVSEKSHGSGIQGLQGVYRDRNSPSCEKISDSRNWSRRSCLRCRNRHRSRIDGGECSPRKYGIGAAQMASVPILSLNLSFYV